MNYKNLVAFYLFAVFGLAACSKHGNVTPIDNSLKNDTNVYVAGSVYALDGYVQAAYWRNGVLTILQQNATDPLSTSQVSAVATYGHDVYFAGYTHGNGNMYATFWKNGVESLLPSNDQFAQATGIAVNENDVYVCGYSYDTPDRGGRFKAVCWKNGVAVDLEYPTNSYARAIAIKNNDVYIAGDIGTPFGTTAAYWKNGKAVILNNDNITAAGGHSIYLDGTDVYVAGSVALGPGDIFGQVVATYWKNGKAIMVGDPAKHTDASFITVHNGDVHILGTLTIDNLDSPVYWKNGVVSQLNTGYKDFSAIAFQNDDSYVLGSLNDNGYYNKNGKNVKLGNLANYQSIVYSMAISPY